MEIERVYLDNNAATPVDPRVLDKIIPLYGEKFGNPASTSHLWGWEAEETVKIAREAVSGVLNCDANSIIFTSGATESINLALMGLSHKQPKRFLYSTIEHKAVLDTVKRLCSLDFECLSIPVDSRGLIDLDALSVLLKTPTLLTSIIGANNEIGTVQDLKSISDLCSENGSYLHLDLSQALGKIPLDLSTLKVDLASFSSHKIYGPKGCGALYVAPSVSSELRPIITGGGQERGFRAGTLNVPAIAGFGEACKIVADEFDGICSTVSSLTSRLYKLIQAHVPDLGLNGSPTQRIPGNLSLIFPDVKADQMIARLASTVAVSSSSACLSGDKSGSHVLKAIGLSKTKRESTIRIGVGRFNTEEEIDFAAQKLLEAYRSGSGI